MATTASFTVSTDRLDYAPASTAYITAAGVGAGATVQFAVRHVNGPGADGLWGTFDDEIGDNSGAGHSPWIVTDGGAGDLDPTDGVIRTSWFVDPDDSLGATFLLTAATAGADGAFDTEDDPVTSAKFTDGNPALDLNQWETKTNQWANGQANVNQATYLEGDVVPYSLEAKNLTVGTTYGVRITLDTYQSNTDAGGFLYLDTYTRSISPLPDNFSHTGALGTPVADAAFTFNDTLYANPGLQFS